MVRKQGPGVDRPGALLCESREAGHEIAAVGVGAEDLGALNSPHHDVMEGVRGIEAGLARHEGERSISCTNCQRPGILTWWSAVGASKRG